LSIQKFEYLQRFLATFCAKWTPTSLPRPTDRNPERTKAWIEEIYQNKKYFSDDASASGDSNGRARTTETSTPAQKISASSPQANDHGAPTAKGNGVDSIAINKDEDAVHVLEITDLGTGMAKLQVGSPVTSSSSSVSPSKHVKPPPAELPKLQMPMPGTVQTSPPAVKAVSSSAPAESQEASPQAAEVAADLVTVPEPPIAAVPTAAVAPTPSLMDAWDPFGAVEGPVANTPHSSAPVTAPAAPPGAVAAPVAVPAPVANGNGPSNAAAVDDPSFGWDAFADQAIHAVPEEKDAKSTAPAALHALSAPSDAAPVAPSPTQAAPAAGWAVDFSSQASVPAPPPQQQSAPMPAPVPAPSPPSVLPDRKEISLDTFYPEFESIRATGVLPTGQPLLQAQMTQWGVSPYSQQQQQQQQHAQQHGQHQFAGGIVPPSPAAGGHTYHHHPGSLPSPGYAHLSPLQQQQQQQQQHGMYPAGTPTGSYYPAPSPVYNQPHQQYVSPSMQQQHIPLPSPTPQPLQSRASSAGSFGGTASGASPSSSQGKLGVDPFAHLAPSGVGNQGQKHAIMPTPSAPSPPPSVAVSAPNAVVPGSQTQAASATLYGTGTNLTAYDLSAPAAPKPRAGGNPFA